MQALVASQHTHGIDYLGISEHCTNISQPKTKSSILQSLRGEYTGRLVLQIDSGQMLTTTTYLPGGTAAILLGNECSRIEPSGTNGDAMGRWSYITLRRTSKPPLIIYTVYQVCATPTNDIGTTAWHQQRLHLDANGRPNVHPRTAFIDDLILDVNHHTQMGYDVILGGDMNDTLYYPRSNILRLARATNLIDPWTKFHPNNEDFHTYHRGSKRIDAIFCTASVLASIRSMGYAPYQWFTESDHRALLLDLDLKTLLGKPADPLASPSMRGFRTNDRQHVATFISHWYQHLLSNNVFATALRSDDASFTSHDIEKLDALIGQGGDSAEQRCKRRRPAFYSNRLAQLRATKSITKANFRAHHRGKSKLRPILQARLRLYGIALELSSTAAEASAQHIEAQSDLAEYITDHREKRNQELDAKIDAATATGKRSKARAIRTIRRSETARQTWQIIQFVKMKQGCSQKLDRLDIPKSWPAVDPTTTDAPTNQPSLEDPKSCNEWRTLTDPSEIEHYLQLRNRGHFGQAQGTPFTESPFVSSLDWPAHSELSESILAGMTPSHLSDVPQCQALLSACQTVSDLDLLPASLTPSDFSGKIKTWNENTSTSPSGRHLGRYKALYARGPFTTKTPDDKAAALNLLSEQAAISAAILSVINFCIRTGYVLHRWKTIINTMIFKETGNYKIHRLRVIHIYEADFNLLLAVKWRQLLRSADSRQAINEGLFGGRPGCEAQSLTFLEELKYDISYASRRTLFNFDNDATSCYDRIIVSLASLINRKYGLHRQVTLVHASTLEQAQFHLRTQHGYSEKYYSHSLQFPIYGTGQGSGNSPCIWLFVSSTLCDVHQSLCHGATFTSPDGEDTVKIGMVGFVDDSTGTCNDFQPQTQSPIADITQRMQHDAQVWNDLLWCSGGKLELPKCSFHVLQFEFEPDGTPTPVLTASDYEIQLIDAENGATIRIQPKRTDDPHKTLGHWKSPTTEKKQSTQMTELIKKAKTTMALITISQLTRYGTTLAYHGVYIATLRYVLPQCFFNPKDLDTAERQTIQPILARCGYNRNTALQLRYAPTTYAGCGFIRWTTLQGEGQIGLFLKHWRTSTTLSYTLRIAKSWCQWQSGLSRSIFRDTRTPLPHLESRWMNSLRDFLHTIQATLHLDRAKTVPPERSGDIYIMEDAIQSALFNDKEIRIINYCRQYLHVTTVSELFDSTGTKLLPYMYECTQPPWTDPTQYRTLQRRPSQIQIDRRWKKLCRRWSTPDGTRLPAVSIGLWTHRGYKFRQRRESYLEHGTLYHWIRGHYWTLTPNQSRPFGYFLPHQSTDWTPTNIATPVHISRIPSSRQPDEFYTTSDFALRIAPPVHPPPTTPIVHPPTFHEYIQQLPPWERTLLQLTQLDNSALEIISEINDISLSSAPIFAVSDGACKHGTTSFGWTIGTEYAILASGNGPGSGPATSHRAECWGMLAAARFLHHLQIYTGHPFLPTMHLVPYADNLSMISSLNKRLAYATVYPNATLQPDWDLLEEIHHTLTHLPQIKLEYQWVCGHQTNDRSRQPPEVTYNINSDRLARAYIKSNQTPQLISPVTPSARCILQIQGATVHGQYWKHIREAASVPALFDYLRARYHWDSTIIQEINWTWFTTASTYYKHTDNHLMKLVHDQLPTRTRKAKTGGQGWIPAICQHCHNAPETFDHLLQCLNDTSSKFRYDLTKALQSYCERQGAPPAFTTTLVTAVEDWLHSRIPLSSVTQHQAIIQLAQAQHRIGWTRFFRGFLSQEWRLYLEYEIPRTERRRIGDRTIDDFEQFFSGLIRVLWTCQSTFWTAHQSTIHKPHHETISPAKISETIAEVRYLYSMRNKVPERQREEYFPKDIQTFLKTSSHQQLLYYLANYKPAIRAIIQLEKKKAEHNPPIYQYRGFTRPPSATTQPRRAIPLTQEPPPLAAQPSPTTIPRPTSVPHPPSTTPTLRTSLPLTQSTLTGPLTDLVIGAPAMTRPGKTKEKPLHKHSKWKPAQSVLDGFRNFFT